MIEKTTNVSFLTSKYLETSGNPLCQLQKLSILQKCKNLSFIVDLALILAKLYDTKGLQVLCKVLEIATIFAQEKYAQTNLL